MPVASAAPTAVESGRLRYAGAHGDRRSVEPVPAV